MYKNIRDRKHFLLLKQQSKDTKNTWRLNGRILYKIIGENFHADTITLIRRNGLGWTWIAITNCRRWVWSQKSWRFLLLYGKIDLKSAYLLLNVVFKRISGEFRADYFIINYDVKRAIATIETSRTYLSHQCLANETTSKLGALEKPHA